MWEWISEYIILPLLGWLGEKGWGWAKEKVKNASKSKKNTPEEKVKTEKSIETILENEAGLKENIEYNFSPPDYIEKVAKLLYITRKYLCNDTKPCHLIGTTTLSPSQIMSFNLMPYQQVWENHSNECHQLHKDGKYIPQRVICSSYAALKEDVTNRAGECDTFFNWCDDTDFEVRMLFKNYGNLMKRYKIELQDFMLFADKFVFGSLDLITSDKIRCKLIISNDKLRLYMDTARAISNKNNMHSKDIKTTNELTVFLEEHKKQFETM